MRERASFDAAFDITWYPGRYDNAFRSIFAVGDVTQYVPDSEARRPTVISSAVAYLCENLFHTGVALSLLLSVCWCARQVLVPWQSGDCMYGFSVRHVTL